MNNVLLIGTGPMALDYVKVLNALHCKFTVVGRGENSANEFEKKCGIKPVTGGLDKFLAGQKFDNTTSAIVATGTETLMNCLLQLTKAGISNILVEKPAAVSIDELLENENALNDCAEKIFVAYNRRFYASVSEVIKLIEQDGGLLSMNFEFTEWAHKIDPLVKAPGVKENWFFANSTHVIDLAFYMAGMPKNWQAYSHSGKISWHSQSNFAGAGITDKGVVFNYAANWESAGRWGIELLTCNRRIFLKPLEKIAIQNKGSIEIQQHEFNDEKDVAFKPGLFNQTEEFLTCSKKNVTSKSLLSFRQHIANTKNTYIKILG